MRTRWGGPDGSPVATLQLGPPGATFINVNARFTTPATPTTPYSMVAVPRR